MFHSYEKNIAEIKNELTNYLVTILTNQIYIGYKSIYNSCAEKFIKLKKKKSFIVIFKNSIVDIPNLNANKIFMEYKRIKNSVMYSDIFDDLVKSVIKSYIVLLSFNTSPEESEIIKKKIHEYVRIDTFIHSCYIESAKLLVNHLELFVENNDKNKTKIFDKIKSGIINAIYQTLPMKDILTEYLKKDYLTKEELYYHVRQMTNPEVKENVLNIPPVLEINESDKNNRYGGSNKSNFHLGSSEHQNNYSHKLIKLDYPDLEEISRSIGGKKNNNFGTKNNEKLNINIKPLYSQHDGKNNRIFFENESDSLHINSIAGKENDNNNKLRAETNKKINIMNEKNDLDEDKSNLNNIAIIPENREIPNNESVINENENNVAEPNVDKNIFEPNKSEKIAESIEDEKIAEPDKNEKIAEPIKDEKTVKDENIAEPDKNEKIAEPDKNEKINELYVGNSDLKENIVFDKVKTNNNLLFSKKAVDEPKKTNDSDNYKEKSDITIVEPMIIRNSRNNLKEHMKKKKKPKNDKIDNKEKIKFLKKYT